MITFNMESWTINRVNSLKDKIGMLSVCDPEVIRFKEKKQENHMNKTIIV